MCCVFSSSPFHHPREHRASQSQCRTLSSWPWRWRVWCSTAQLPDSSGRSSQSVLMLLQFFRARRDLTTRCVASVKFFYVLSLYWHLNNLDITNHIFIVTFTIVVTEYNAKHRFVNFLLFKYHKNRSPCPHKEHVIGSKRRISQTLSSHIYVAGYSFHYCQ